MEFEDMQVLTSPNIYTIKDSVIKIRLKLGDLCNTPTKDIANFNDKIITLFPGLINHKCSLGYVGGFLDRLREGTYLAHVTEHLCLELQATLGYDVKFGKALKVHNDIYNVIFACKYGSIGEACGIFIFNLIKSIIDQKDFNFDKNLIELKKFCMKNEPGPSTKAIIEESKYRGIPVSEINGSGILRLGYGKHQRYLSATLCENTSCIAVDIACDKSLTKHILEQELIPTAKGKVCKTPEEALIVATKIGYPIVIKPKSGNHGKNVFIDINTPDELKSAFTKIINNDDVIIEKLVKGKDYRLLIINGNLVAAAERVPAHVIGNSINSIEELIDYTNASNLRGEDHEKPLTKITIDENTNYILKSQGFDLQSIPGNGQKVWLKSTANLSTGGTAIDCTDIVHPKNKKTAELAVKAIGLDIAGVDMVIPDIRNPIDKDYGAIIEVNAAPGIRMHLYPTEGVKRNVVSPILDMIYPKNTPHSIPIISITGTNGKTTTTRMISHILKNHGLCVGKTTTHGIFINDTCIEKGDTTGPISSRRILNNRSVDIAVLETARGGIIRGGLAYEKADVGVLTNISEDHLGLDEVDSLEDLFHVKSLVLETVKETGTCVLNADDPWIMRALEKAKGRVVLYSLNEENKFIKKHQESGGTVVYKADNNIIIVNGYIPDRTLALEDIPATLNGSLDHNTYNAMASIGACYASGVPFSAIRKGLSTFSLDVECNPGRFNIFEISDFKVILDYGHNIDGYKVTINGLKSLNPERLIGIIGVPGDRRNEDIKNVGTICAKEFDKVIIKEDIDLRGRKPFEVANILYDQLVNEGMSENNIKIIEDEKDALNWSIQNAQDGDVIAVFFEKFEPLYEIIKEAQINTPSYVKIPSFH